MINTAPCPGLRKASTSTSPPQSVSVPQSSKHARRATALTVRLLVPRAGAGTAELLGLAPPVVGDEEGAVVLDERLLELVLGVLVDELLVVGDDGFGDSLADGVDLGGVATAGDADADVDVGCCHSSIQHSASVFWALES